MGIDHLKAPLPSLLAPKQKIFMQPWTNSTIQPADSGTLHAVGSATLRHRRGVETRERWWGEGSVGGGSETAGGGGRGRDRVSQQWERRVDVAQGSQRRWVRDRKKSTQADGHTPNTRHKIQHFRVEIHRLTWCNPLVGVWIGKAFTSIISTGHRFVFYCSGPARPRRVVRQDCKSKSYTQVLPEPAAPKKSFQKLWHMQFFSLHDNWPWF